MWSSQNSVLLSMGMTFFVDFNNPPPPASSSFISILCLDFFFVWLPDLCVSIHVLESIFLMFAKLKYFILKLASDDLRSQRGLYFEVAEKSIEWPPSASEVTEVNVTKKSFNFVGQTLWICRGQHFLNPFLWFSKILYVGSPNLYPLVG